MLTKRRALTIVISLAVASMPVACCCIGNVLVAKVDSLISPTYDPDDEKVRCTMDIGNRIIEAIERYRGEHGDRLPGELSALVPGCLEQIPPPLVGSGEWEYRIYPTHYQLRFKSLSGRSYGYIDVLFGDIVNQQKEWHFHTGAPIIEWLLPKD